MPAGRGRKGERAPRSRRGKQTNTVVVPRILAPAPATVQSTPLVPANVHGLVCPMYVNSLYPVSAVPSLLPESRSLSTEAPFHLQQPSILNNASNSPPAAGAWHSGLSPHLYYLVPLPTNVRKCYGCGNNFVAKFRQPPHNIVVKHIDRRLVRRDPATAALVYSPDFTNTYYHPSFAHIQRKNPTFNGLVYIDSAIYRGLDFSQIQALNEYDLNINMSN